MSCQTCEQYESRPDAIFPPDHCLSCHEDQPRPFYIWCFECGHTYRTRWHLLVAYRVKRWQVRRAYRTIDPDDREPVWSVLLGGWWRPSRISFCQCCIHDF